MHFIFLQFKCYDSTIYEFYKNIEALYQSLFGIFRHVLRLCPFLPHSAHVTVFPSQPPMPLFFLGLPGLIFPFGGSTTCEETCSGICHVVSSGNGFTGISYVFSK